MKDNKAAEVDDPIELLKGEFKATPIVMHNMFKEGYMPLFFFYMICFFGLLDVCVMHLFTSNIKLYSALLATKTDFPPFRKKNNKNGIKN